MARLPAKERRAVGTLAHECGQTATVFQNKRLHLYLNCPQCGHWQDNTAEAQTRIYRAMVRGETSFPPPRNLLPEAAAPAPAGSTAPKTAPEPAPEVPAPAPAAAVDYQKPPAVAESGGAGPAPEPQPKTEKRGGLGLLLIFLGLAGAAAAVLR